MSCRLHDFKEFRTLRGRGASGGDCAASHFAARKAGTLILTSNETAAFPRLEELFPAYGEQLQHFVAQHDGILQVFEILRAELSFDGAPADQRTLQGKALSFEREFEAHAATETTLFNELAAKLTASTSA